jgi:hypothetical protein
MSTCFKVRIIRPDGSEALTREFSTNTEAESRYERAVSACLKDQWFGARVQCLDRTGKVVHEKLIEKVPL